MGPKSLIGHRTYHNTTALVIKSRFRKNVRGGRVLIHPCLCAMVSPPSRAFCPVHGFWATNRDRLTPGGLLSPNASTDNFSRRLKRPCATSVTKTDAATPPRAIRRGSTHAILNSGSTFQNALKSGIPTSGGYKCYIDLRADEAINISALLASALGSDSDDPNTLPTALTTKTATRPLGGQETTTKTQKGGPPAR